MYLLLFKKPPDNNEKKLKNIFIMQIKYLKIEFSAFKSP